MFENRNQCGSRPTRIEARPAGARIAVYFRVEKSAPGAWDVVVLHERRVSWRGAVLAKHNRLEVRSVVQNFPGTDAITVRASDALGVVCTLTVSVPDPVRGSPSGK